jgi:hypothetical protein
VVDEINNPKEPNHIDPPEIPHHPLKRERDQDEVMEVVSNEQEESTRTQSISTSAMESTSDGAADTSIHPEPLGDALINEDDELTLTLEFKIPEVDHES